MTRIESSVKKHLALVACIIVIATQLQIHALAQGVEAETEITIEYSLPENIDTSFKAYMDYRCITDTTSPQYELQEKAHTDEQGFRRIDDDYIVAVGTYYTDTCGDRFIVTLEDDTEFTVTVGDIKQDRHTDRSNMYYPMGNGKGNILEFVVDTIIMDDHTLMLGDVSGLGFEGQIKSISKIIEIKS